MSCTNIYFIESLKWAFLEVKMFNIWLEWDTFQCLVSWSFIGGDLNGQWKKYITDI
jgi:hypothetical protein